MAALLFNFSSPEGARDYLRSFLKNYDLSIEQFLDRLKEANLTRISSATFYRWMKNPRDSGWRIQLLATCLQCLEESGSSENGDWIEYGEAE